MVVAQLRHCHFYVIIFEQSHIIKLTDEYSLLENAPASSKEMNLIIRNLSKGAGEVVKWEGRDDVILCFQTKPVSPASFVVSKTMFGKAQLIACLAIKIVQLNADSDCSAQLKIKSALYEWFDQSELHFFLQLYSARHNICNTKWATPSTFPEPNKYQVNFIGQCHVSTVRIWDKKL